ncbi:hypothetical protein ASF91_06510 [Rhizobium sp. Leaf155]|nr:hypothetical protein ASF91_06510 [Rhizobium sp. Leaf155]
MAIHVSYATPNFSQAAQLIKKSALRMGIAQSRIYSPDEPIITRLTESYPHIMRQQRGAGYWLWKPYIIGDILDNVVDGTVVIYTDVAMTFISDPAPLERLVQDFPVALFHLVPVHKMSTWTKRDCFIALGADSETFWDMPQLTAAFQVYRACDEAREFISALKIATSNQIQLTDAPNSLGKPNLSDFRDHRHDQSILTILAHRYGIKTYPDPSQFGPWRSGAEAEEYPQLFHMHRWQNRGMLKYLKNRYRRKFTGGRFFI